MSTLKEQAINRLLARRKSLQDAYDALIDGPATYSIQGSVSATNQKMSELRREIDALDVQITELLGISSGISRSYPNYNH